MIIILAEGQGFNNSWDKPRPAKNGTASLRVHLSQFTFNETGQRLSGHLGTGSSSPTIRTVMLAQFWSCTWAQIPHCTYCVDLYLGLILGGSQPCPGSEAVAVNEAGSLSCPASPPDWQITLSAMPPKPRLRSSPPGPEWTSPTPFPAFLRDAGASRAPVPLRGALRAPAALAAAHAVPWRCHRETGPAALSGGTSAACMGTAAGRELRAEFLSVQGSRPFFWRLGLQPVRCEAADGWRYRDTSRWRALQKASLTFQHLQQNCRQQVLALSGTRVRSDADVEGGLGLGVRFW